MHVTAAYSGNVDPIDKVVNSDPGAGGGENKKNIIQNIISIQRRIQTSPLGVFFLALGVHKFLENVQDPLKEALGSY